MCQCCGKRWAQDRNRLCRTCAHQLNLETASHGQRHSPVDANRHGNLNGYTLGAFCPVRVETPKPRYVAQDGRGTIVLEVVWNGA